MERAGVKRFAWLLWWRGMGIALQNKDVVNVEGLLCNATFSGDALRSNVVVRHKIGIAEYLHNLPKNVQWWISFLVPAVWHVLCTRGSDSTACGIDSQTHAGLASHAQNIHRTWQRHIIWQKKKRKQRQQHRLTGKASYRNLYLCFCQWLQLYCGCKGSSQAPQISCGQEVGEGGRIKTSMGFSTRRLTLVSKVEPNANSVTLVK